jgi:hypothetical protein
MNVIQPLLNSPFSSRILAAIFGLIRYWVDKHNIQQFEYGAESNTRIKLYNYYLTKHFPDFENTNKVELIDSDIFIWEKKK